MAKKKERVSGNALTNKADYRNAIKPVDYFAIGNQAPDRAYRFISKTLLDKNGGFDRRGWEPITQANHKGEVLISPWGTIGVGTDLRLDDLVLAFMPKQRQDAKRRAMKIRQDMMRNTIYRLRNQMQAAGMEHQMKVQIQRPGRTDDSAFENL